MKRLGPPLVMALALSGCATIVHGPYQDVRLDSTPPGATVTVAPTLSERGPGFLDEKKEQTVTTPGTVRLLRDNTYRLEFNKPGYKIQTRQVAPSYDWLWAQVLCGVCEAVGELPSYDMKGHALPLRFLEGAFYEYPKGAFRAMGQATRIFSPDALMGNSYKLKPQGAGYFNNWHAMGPTDVSANLEAE